MSKIMVVDDSNLSRNFLRKMLESAGYEVIEARDGAEALARYALDRPDLVLLDLVMAGIDGWEVLSKLKERDNNARIIVATADIQTSTYQMALEAGACELVTKPFNPEQILKVVSESLPSPSPVGQGGASPC